MNASFRTAEVFASLQRQFGPVNRLLLLLGLILMVLTPISLRLCSQPVLTLMLAFSTIAQVGLILGRLRTAWNATRVLGIGLAVARLAWLLEYAGVRTGLPFGTYSYTGAL